MTGWAVVTGASGGLGTGFSRELARQGANLILVARSADKLEALAAELRASYHVLVETWPCDLTNRGARAVLAADLASRLEAAGLTLEHRDFFDTLSVYVSQGAVWAVARAADRGVNIRHLDTKYVGISINELITTAHLDAVVSALTDTDSPKAKQAGPGHQGHHAVDGRASCRERV